MKYIAMRRFKLGRETPITPPDESGDLHLDEYVEVEIGDEQRKHKDIQFFINSQPPYLVESESEMGKKKAAEGRKRKADEEAKKQKANSPIPVLDVNHAVHKSTKNWTIAGVIVAIIALIIAVIALLK